MLIKNFKSTSPGIRHQINIKKNLLSKNNRFFKKKIKINIKKSGRSTQTGRITVWHKGGGHKKLFRPIHSKKNIKIFIILCIMYEPNKKCFNTLNFDPVKKFFFFNLMTNKTCPGSIIQLHNENFLKLGSFLTLEKIPAGTIIHSITNKKGQKVVFSRAAGTFSQIIQKTLYFCKIKLPSGKIIKLKLDNFATIGMVSNTNHNLINLGKAGKARYLGKRPTVRGVAMNPVDHPHGGRTNGGRPSVTPWGILTKGFPTRKKVLKI